MIGLKIVHEVGRAITVLDGATELLRYVYSPDSPQLESPKPYLHPLRTRAGNLVSLFRPHDHVWHKGIALSLPHMGEENFWGGPTYVHGRFYVQFDNNGTQRHRDITGIGGSAGAVVFSHDLDWETQRGRPWFGERRSLTARILSDSSWALVFETELTNVSGGVVSIGSPTTKGRENAGYGGLFWRGPRAFTGGRLVSPSGEGADELRGKREPWMAFAGRHDDSGAESMVLMVDHVENPRHPPQWFARSAEFACLNPAPFFSEELEVAVGETVRLRYGVGFADGSADLAPELARAVGAALTDPTPVPAGVIG